MAEEETNPSPEDAADAPTPEEAPQDEVTPDAEAGSEADADSEAEDLAAQALKAAQAAVSGLSESSDVADDATAAASDDADAAMAAMLEDMQGAKPVDMPAFAPGKLADIPKGINLLSDVNLDVTIELGRTRMYVEDVLKLSEGAVVELDKLAGDPVDIYVNHRHVAKGEVLILNDNFCVRINEIVEIPAEAAG